MTMIRSSPMAMHGIDCAERTAWQLVNSDCGEYDMLVGIGRVNL